MHVDWFYMYNSAGTVASDSLSGTAVSRSLEEIKLFHTPRKLNRFLNKNMTQMFTGQYVRYFKPWTVQEYLVVSGDMASWVKFTPANLQQSITLAQQAGSFPACVNFVMNTSTTLLTRTVKAMYRKSGADILFGLSDLTCPSSAVSRLS